jgi:deoxyribonuclease-4
MYIGLHVSAAGGAMNAPTRAAEKNCETFQFFSRSPQGGKAPELTPEIVEQFTAGCKTNGFTHSYMHTPYFINFASLDNRIRHGSISIVRGELERASLLGVTAVMTHLGSSKGRERAEAEQCVIDGVREILTGYTGSAKFLMELAAGAGDILGASLEELARYIAAVEKDKKLKNKIGICLDTCHAFAVGYDLRDKKTVDAFVKKFDEVIGLERLVVIHANDSKTDFNSRRDRHEHIDEGKIGKDGFAAIVRHPKLKSVDLICETPHDGKELKDIALLKKLRGK